jgi:hypothetical protein
MKKIPSTAAAELRGFHTLSGPTVSPKPDYGVFEARAIQCGLVAARKGAYDKAVLTAHEGLLPGEVWIDAMVDQAAEECRIHALGTAAGNHAAKFDGRHAPASYEHHYDHLEKRQKYLEDIIERETTQRDAAVAVLTGETLHNGAAFTGHLPSAPVVAYTPTFHPVRTRLLLALRPTRLARSFVDILATMIFFFIEAGIIAGPVQDATHASNLLQAAVLSISGIVATTIIPHFIGVTLATLSHGAPLTRRRSIPLFGAVLWLGGGVMLSKVRADAGAQSLRDMVAAQQSITPAQVNLAGQYDWWSVFLLFLLFTLGLGAGIILLKVGFYNPCLTRTVKADNTIALAESELVHVRAARAGHTALADANGTLTDDHTVTHQAMIDDIEEQYTVFTDTVLPAWKKTLHAVYRTELINALADPGITVILATGTPHRAQLTTVPTEKDTAA